MSTRKTERKERATPCPVVRILHTCDLHGYLGTLPRLVTLIERERSGEPNSLLLDAGDMFSPGPSADLQLELLSSVGYDAVVPGNADRDQETTAAMLARLGCPVVAANIAALPGMPHVVPYVIRETGGLRIGVLGLSVPSPYPAGHRLEVAGCRGIPVQDPLETARAFVPRLRKEVDLLILLSHLGIRSDVRVAHEVPGIDLVVGGHSHHRVFAPIVVGNTAVVQAGPQGSHLGVVDIEAERIGSFCTIRESVARTVAALAVRPGLSEWPPIEGRLAY